MDPTQCMINLLDAGLIGDHEMMKEHASDLTGWLFTGGFPPDETVILAWLVERASEHAGVRKPTSHIGDGVPGCFCQIGRDH